MVELVSILDRGPWNSRDLNGPILELVAPRNRFAIEILYETRPVGTLVAASSRIIARLVPPMIKSFVFMSPSDPRQECGFA